MLFLQKYKWNLKLNDELQSNVVFEKALWPDYFVIGASFIFISCSNQKLACLPAFVQLKIFISICLQAKHTCRAEFMVKDKPAPLRIGVYRTLGEGGGGARRGYGKQPREETKSRDFFRFWAILTRTVPVLYRQNFEYQEIQRKTLFFKKFSMRVKDSCVWVHLEYPYWPDCSFPLFPFLLER